MKCIITILMVFSLIQPVFSQKKDVKKAELTEKINAGTLSGLKARLIGPAVTSGRISDLAVDPNDRSYFIVAVAYGGVWKTTNGGVTFSSIFDGFKPSSIGCVTLDPTNRNVIWVGTGENNSQRAVGWGDGIYKSSDGGKSWKNMGLKQSEHIGKIVIDPRNSNVLYVAVQGPLWNSGGDRGLYKTTDAGNTWQKILNISENTGVSDLVLDPRNPDVIYCSSYQRRRTQWTLINGGPEGAVYKSIDGGKSFDKLSGGLPGGYVGRIGLAISPANPDILFALVEAGEDSQGLYRTTNRGASWERRSPTNSVSPQYYQEIFCDPIDIDKIYIVDTYSRVSTDGGANFRNLSTKERHVDDHALFIDPKNTNYLLIGGDGGLYESFDSGNTWRFFENLPITQFYRVQADNTEPFYFVYGGTQDNNTLAGPSRTTSSSGILNQDWHFTVGGDGFESQIDPKDPNIVYSQWQYGGLIRFDKKNGEMLGIKPQEEKGEELRWNWDSPLIISPHNNQRLYYAANKLFRSDDRGNSWVKISDDLSRQLNRDALPVMGKIWDPEAIAKNASTSYYGNIIALSESPKKEGLLYVGTDDGLLQITEDNGKSWKRIDKFPTVPETTFVSDLVASMHDENRLFITFNNHKAGDFKPYVLRSDDRGNSWVSIVGNLPTDEPVWCLIEDHINPNLLFLGTEFGLYTSTDGGKKWLKLSAGLPPAAIRDLDIQQRENDLVIGTFGRGIYIIDDYSPLRTVNEDLSLNEAKIFPIKDALMYIEEEMYGRRALGDDFYRAENPAFGAVFTYYLRDSYKTKKQIRKDKEKKDIDEGRTISYPSSEALREEDNETKPYLIFTIRDQAGIVVRQLTANPSTGINRMVWDLRLPDTSPVGEKTNTNKHSGLLIAPGIYSVSLSLIADNQVKLLVPPVNFNVKPLRNHSIPVAKANETAEFNKKIQELQRIIYGANNYSNAVNSRIESIKNVLKVTPNAELQMIVEINDIDKRFSDLLIVLNGDRSKSKRNVNQTLSLNERLNNILYSIWQSTADPTATNIKSYEIAIEQTNEFLSKLNLLVENDLKRIETKLDELKAPLTPERVPQIKK